MWTPEADAIVLNHVERFGAKSWGMPAAAMGSKVTARHVRERWLYALDPNINHAPFTADEDARIEELFIKSCGSWCVMAQNMPGRTDLQIKNRWHITHRPTANKPNNALHKSLTALQPSEIADLFSGADGTDNMPASPPEKKRARQPAVVPVVVPIAKKPKSSSPCMERSMTKFTVGGSRPVEVREFKVNSTPGTSFAALNLVLNKIPDARRQKWDGLGKL